MNMMTSFWNNLLPGNAQSQKMGKPNNFKVFQNNKAKGSRQEDKQVCILNNSYSMSLKFILQMV